MSKESVEFKEISADLIAQYNQQRAEYIDSVFSYRLNENLEELAYALRLKEIKNLGKKYELKSIDEDPIKLFDFADELLINRGLDRARVDELGADELQIYARRVLLASFDAKAIAKKS